MKYFTIDNWMHDEGPLSGTTKQYENYFLSIKKKLPKKLQEFYEKYNFFDGTIVNLSMDLLRKEGKLKMFIYDNQEVDEHEAHLFFKNLHLCVFKTNLQKHVNGPLDGFGDIGYDEIELLNDSRWELRLLFSTGIELEVQFEDFDFEILPPSPNPNVTK